MAMTSSGIFSQVFCARAFFIGKFFLRILTLLIGSASAGVLAHNGVDHAAQSKANNSDSLSHSIDISLVSTWRSAAAVNDTTAWRLPGFLMGSAALPADEGVAIDEFSLGGRWVIDPQFYAVAKLGTHAEGKGSDHHGGGVELQHAFIGWRSLCDSLCVNAEIGKMSALFTPYVGEHTSARLFSETSLIQDVFFGRDFHDQGLRGQLSLPMGIHAGFETWRGNAFPATANDDGKNNDVFAYYAFNQGAWRGRIGAWVMRAEAANRYDARYSLEEQHGITNTPLFVTQRFTGTQNLQGVYTQLHWAMSDTWALALNAEWLESTSEGELGNNSGVAALRSEARGMRIEPALVWRTHTWALRAEQLTVDNYVAGSAAAAISQGANLNTRGHNPERLSVSWQWQWRPSIALRSEYVRDNSLPSSASRVNVGVIWQQGYTPVW